ncbi:hypothetical protein [Ureibacillus manganicus]|uniref:Lipoprotein n=1 Tax=Ureibacillus manganicus DSM 26584 TaxID=1384049 RepID=A0A0A3I8H9_9BACL|nr:hypothetical protein [Ureibacillus manganicus]KGR79063.1 hypothetical protein CD29_08645 [Ureibacillus manganicus DSM 26584]
MIKIKKFPWIVLLLMLPVIFSGCSASEVIRVGTPVNGMEAIKFDKENEIKDTKSIEALRAIISEVREIEEPKDLDSQPDTFFSLDRPKEGIAEMWLYVYYQDDGSSILYNNGANLYFALSEEQTNELRSILKQ